MFARAIVFKQNYSQEEMRIVLHKVGKKRTKEKADLLFLPLANGMDNIRIFIP